MPLPPSSSVCRYMNKKIALILLSIGWTLGFTIAMLPIFFNNWHTAEECEFEEILPAWYVAGVITPTFGMVWVCLLTLYFRIWREASRHVKQIRSSLADGGPSDWKSVQVSQMRLPCSPHSVNSEFLY